MEALKAPVKVFASIFVMVNLRSYVNVIEDSDACVVPSARHGDWEDWTEEALEPPIFLVDVDSNLKPCRQSDLYILGRLPSL